MQKTKTQSQKLTEEGWMKVNIHIGGQSYRFEAWTQIKETETRVNIILVESNEKWSISKRGIKTGESSLTYFKYI